MDPFQSVSRGQISKQREKTFLETRNQNLVSSKFIWNTQRKLFMVSGSNLISVKEGFMNTRGSDLVYEIIVVCHKPSNHIRVSDSCQVWLLETDRYHSIDQVFPFLRAVADKHCKNNKFPNVTNASTQYLARLSFQYCCAVSASWSRNVTAISEIKALEFKRDVEVFHNKCQTSKASAPKQHSIESLPNAKRQVCSAMFLHEGYYKAGNQALKYCYDKTRRQSRSVVREAVS